MTKTASLPAGGAPEERVLHDKPIPLRLLAGERSEAIALAAKEGRSVSNFARQVYRDGMAMRRAQTERAA